MKPAVSKKKQIAGLLYGLAAGLAFAIFAWGVDAVLLARAHGAYPWIKFIPGSIICLVAGGFVGWLTMFSGRSGLGTIAWLGLGLLFSRLVYWLPVKILPGLVRLINLPIGDYLNYSETRQINEITWLGSFILLGVAVGFGAYEKGQINEYVYADGVRIFVASILICFVSFSLAGALSDTLVNKKLRQPVQVLDQSFQFVLENKNPELPEEIARATDLEEIKKFANYIPGKRALIPSSLLQGADQVDVLIVLDGMWVKCTTVFSRIISCEPALNEPAPLKTKKEPLPGYVVSTPVPSVYAVRVNTGNEL